MVILGFFLIAIYSKISSTLSSILYIFLYGYGYWQYFALCNLISPRLSLLTFLFPLRLYVLAFFPPHCGPVHPRLLTISACVCL